MHRETLKRSGIVPSCGKDGENLFKPGGKAVDNLVRSSLGECSSGYSGGESVDTVLKVYRESS